MDREPVLKKIQKMFHGSFRSYFIGLIASLLITSLAFFLVIKFEISKTTLIYTLISLALIQAVIHFIFFLHVGQEEKPRYEVYSLLFTLLILVIIVVGSLWIMNDLNDRMMPDMNMEMSHD